MAQIRMGGYLLEVLPSSWTRRNCAFAASIAADTTAKRRRKDAIRLIVVTVYTQLLNAVAARYSIVFDATVSFAKGEKLLLSDSAIYWIPYAKVG